MKLRVPYSAKNFLVSYKSMLASKEGLGSKDLFVWFFSYLAFGWIISYTISLVWPTHVEASPTILVRGRDVSS